MKKIMYLLTMMQFVWVSLWAIKPIKEYNTTPKIYNIQFEENYTKSDNANLISWYLKHTKEGFNGKTIIFCNSDFGNMGYSLPIAFELYKKGFDIILFDYRGFGKSSNFSIDTNQVYYNEFCKDLISITKHYGPKLLSPPIIYGRSMGTIIATICYAKEPALFKGQFIYESFIESIDYTTQTISTLKSRKFYCPSGSNKYGEYVKSLLLKKGIIFKGDADNISYKKNSTITSKNWTVIPYKGGHLQSSFVLGTKMYDIIDKL